MEATQPRLLDVVRARIRARHYSLRTEKAYVFWIRRFVHFCRMRHPRDLGAPEVEAFLTHLAVDAKVSASTQNQGLAAILFLYRNVLESTRVPTATPQYTLVNIYLVNKYRYTNNLPPFERTGNRYVHSNNIVGGLLDEYFKGPGATEKYQYGWIAIYDGFTGYSQVQVIDGIARVYLTGSCEPANPNYTIANLLTKNLKQFPEIQYVKIYDQNGLTQDPFGSSDSVPACLMP